ncbi:hypothetical protein BH24ACI4_BH24ACI4_12800 [soil metagenome]
MTKSTDMSDVPEHARPQDLRRWPRRVGVTALFAGLTALMTWPQVTVLHTHAWPHHDVYFNLWRLRWFAHALATSPSRLFDGNQFYPERGVLAYSDAMLVEGILGTPLFWLGLPPLLVHNILLLGAIVASAVGAFVLARHLSGSVAGGIVAGVIFAFAPYRIDHYMHMELQWTIWIPWALWAMQRTLETRRTRFGVITGVFVALQMLSSIYYGIFLALLLGLVTAVQLIPLPFRQMVLSVRALSAGAVIAICVSWAYSLPYASASSRVGTRGTHEIRMFSAKPRSYLSATEYNLLYGNTRRGTPERRLFPGIAAMLLALIGLLLVAPPVWTVAYLIGIVAAFELSLGLNSHIYTVLHEHIGTFRGLRAPARAWVLGLLFLAVLAAHGWAALTASGRPILRRALAFGIVGVLLLEYWVAPLHLVAFDNTPPPLYAWLARQPRGLVAEFPMAPPNAPPGEDPRYLYMSTFHWMPLVNGYSGYFPPTYLRRLERVSGFPDQRSVNNLRGEGVKYLIVHSATYTAAEYTEVLETLSAADLRALGRFYDGRNNSMVFALD